MEIKDQSLLGVIPKIYDSCKDETESYAKMSHPIPIEKPKGIITCSFALYLHEVVLYTRISFSELWGARHTFSLMGFLGFAVVYGLRVNLSVAIVAMVNSSKELGFFNSNDLIFSNPELCSPSR